MMGINAIFWIMVILFAIIGMSRGWAKELLVIFSVILALFIITVLEKFVPFVRDSLLGNPDMVVTVFWIRLVILVALVFFAYQTPNIPRIAGTNRFVRERLQDSLLGLFLGALNGYFVFGTIWYFLNEAGYPFSIIIPPEGDIAQVTARLMPLMAPNWLGTPMIYFAVAIAFAFILVVLI